jgi:hypothetical protein
MGSFTAPHRAWVPWRRNELNGGGCKLWPSRRMGKYGGQRDLFVSGRCSSKGKPDLVVAFPGGRGTANMVKQARAAGVAVMEVGRP